MNTTSIVGRIASEPDRREFEAQDGSTRVVCDFRVAVPRQYGSDKADFFTIVCFGRLAEAMSSFGAVGRLVAVEGRLRQEEWAGENRREERVKIRARAIDFLDAPNTAQNVNDDEWVETSELPPAMDDPFGDPIV